MNRLFQQLPALLFFFLIATGLMACGGESASSPTPIPDAMMAPTEASAGSSGAPVALQPSEVPTTTATAPTATPPAVNATMTTAPSATSVATEAPTPTVVPMLELTLPQGTYLYTNGNMGRDGVVFEGKWWVASEGGVVAYDIVTGTGRKYTTADGLPHVAALAITVCPMPEPTLIVSTPRGLVSFDPATGLWGYNERLQLDAQTAITRLACDIEGQRLITNYNTLTILDLNSGETQSFTPESGLVKSYSVPRIDMAGGTVWLTYNGAGVSSVAPDGKVTTYTQEAGTLPTNKVNDIAIGPDGSVWLGSEAGLSQLQEGTFTNTVDDPNFAYFGPGQMAFTSDGTLWMDYTSGMCAWDTATNQCKTVLLYQEHPNMIAGTGGIKGLTSDVQGNLYYYTSYDGSSMWNGSAWQKLSIANEIPPIFPGTLFHEDDNVIVASDGGTYRTSLYAATWERIEDIYSSKVVQTPEGWWMVTSSAVLFYNGSELVEYPRNATEGLLNQFISAIAVDEEGRVYVGHDKGYSIRENGAFYAYGEADGWTMGNVRDMVATTEGVYVATTNGLVLLTSEAMTILLDSTASGLPSVNIAALAQQADGTLILGTTAGVAYYDGVKVTTDPSLTASITDVTTTSDGEIWLTAYSSGTGFLGLGASNVDDGGVYHFDGSHWQHYGVAEGAPGFSLRTIFVDGAGSVWAGGGDSGQGTGIFRIVP